MRVLAEIPPRTSPELRTGTLRRSDLEAFGGLLGELGGARVVVIAGDGPGRLEVSVGLAAAAAAAGTRTALVECDLAEPRLADALGLAQAPGLHEYLRGTAEPDAILKPVVLAGPGSAEATEPLVCVVAGRPAGDAGALLASDRLRPAIEGLRVRLRAGCDRWAAASRRAWAPGRVGVRRLDACLPRTVRPAELRLR